ncbi:MAG: hypothetical protein WA710_15780, partial [Pseudolabrys sp.]
RSFSGNDWIAAVVVIECWAVNHHATLAPAASRLHASRAASQVGQLIEVMRMPSSDQRRWRTVALETPAAATACSPNLREKRPIEAASTAMPNVTTAASAP